MLDVQLIEGAQHTCEQVSNYNRSPEYLVQHSVKEVIFKFKRFVNQTVKVKDIMNLDSEIELNAGDKYKIELKSETLYLYDFYLDKLLFKQKINKPLKFLNSKNYELELNIENSIKKGDINQPSQKTDVFRDKVSKSEKILTKPFKFNEIIKFNEIGYINEQNGNYTFVFKTEKDSNSKDYENFIGYIKYYNGEIKDQNKMVTTFTLKLLEIDGYKYIFATVNIDNAELSKLDIFFIKKEPKEISKFYTLKDLKLIKNVR